jgi:predicted Zn finger-like uncharacterized protein
MAEKHIACPTCKSTLKVDEDHLGQEVECGQCSEVFVAKATPSKSRVVSASPTKEYPDDEPDEPRPVRRKRRRDDAYEDDDEDWSPSRGYEQRKLRLVYILLALFLGSLGIHNFYAGRTGPGIAQLLITVLSFPLMCLFGIGVITIFIPWVWAIVEIVTVDRDGNNVPMTG